MGASESVLGYSVSVTCGGCQLSAIADADNVERILRSACAEAGYEVVQSVKHQFEPYGATCVLILSQSHMMAHSWPEHGLLLVDLFACAPKESLRTAIDSVRDAVAASWLQERNWMEVTVSAEAP